jgi:signal transduction histidine kinase
MGLCRARRAVGRHGGQIWAESTAAAGATFCFTLLGRS